MLTRDIPIKIEILHLTFDDCGFYYDEDTDKLNTL